MKTGERKSRWLEVKLNGDFREFSENRVLRIEACTSYNQEVAKWNLKGEFPNYLGTKANEIWTWIII